MKGSTIVSIAAYATAAAAHGYVKTVTVDNQIYPGFDIHQDEALGAKRIVFAYKQTAEGLGPVSSTKSPDLACNAQAKAPALIAPARAGSNITFQWNSWIINHKGPVITYMAPYEGDIASVNVNQLKFFKIPTSSPTRGGLTPDGALWASDDLIKHGTTWNNTIPWDLKPGKYVVRHEILALHFATRDNQFSNAAGLTDPQFFVMCANVDVSGTGNAVPEGVTFPGGYKTGDPGINFNVYQGKTNYIVPGPEAYVPKGPAPVLEPKPVQIISPTGSKEADDKYYATIKSNDAKFGVITNLVNNLFPTVYGVNGSGADTGNALGKGTSGAASSLGFLEGLIKGSGGAAAAGATENGTPSPSLSSILGGFFKSMGSTPGVPGAPSPQAPPMAAPAAPKAPGTKARRFSA